MAEQVLNNITFENINYSGGIQFPAKVIQTPGQEGQYPLINAVDIDWNGAKVKIGTAEKTEGEETVTEDIYTTINHTTDLLKILQDLASSSTQAEVNLTLGNLREQIANLVQKNTELEEKITKLTAIISIDDADNNGVADGEDRIKNVENESKHTISDEVLTIGSLESK